MLVEVLIIFAKASQYLEKPLLSHQTLIIVIILFPSHNSLP